VKTEGDISIIESYRSLYYLRKEKINRVQVTQEVNNGICNAKFEITLH